MTAIGVRVRDFARFAAVGVVNTLVTLAITHGLRLFAGVPLGPASLIGYPAGVATSFALNRGWTFSTAEGPVAASVVGTGCAFVLNYLGCRDVFRPRPPAPPAWR